MAGWFKNKVDLESIDRGWPRWVRGLTAKITKTFQQLSSKGERAGNNLAQKYLNALHAANLLLQKDTTSYKMIMMADDAGVLAPADDAGVLKVAGPAPDSATQNKHQTLGSNMHPHMREGQVSRRLLVQIYSKAPDLFLNFGPAGDLPIHLICLLGKDRLGIHILSALKSSPEYWRRCEELIKQFGADRMPKLPPEEERNDNDKNDKALRKFVINIPYQHDIVWWFDEFKRRREDNEGIMTGAQLVKHCKFDECVPDNAHCILLDKAAGLFTGETLLHIAIQSRKKDLLEYLIANGADLNTQVPLL